MATGREQHDTGFPWSRLFGAGLLGIVLALLWVSAAHGERDVPRAAMQWLAGTKPEAVSAIYDFLLWTALVAASVIGGFLMLGLQVTHKHKAL